MMLMLGKFPKELSHKICFEGKDAGGRKRKRKRESKEESFLKKSSLKELLN